MGGKATSPRIQTLISKDDKAWVDKYKPKDETVSKFVASLIAEAIAERQRLQKIGASSGDGVKLAAVDAASKVEELNNLCTFFGQNLKQVLKENLDGTQFEDGLLYEAFVLDGVMPDAPTPTDPVELAKSKGWSHQVVAKKAERLPSDDAQTLRLKLLQQVLDQQNKVIEQLQE